MTSAGHQWATGASEPAAADGTLRPLVQIGDWRVRTGLPCALRVADFGLRSSKARVRRMNLAGTVEAVRKNAAQLPVGDDVFGTCNGPFAESPSSSPNRQRHAGQRPGADR